MYDTDELLSYQAQQDQWEKTQRDRNTAINVLWLTGMIPVEEYYYFKPEYYRYSLAKSEIAPRMKSDLDARNLYWEDPYCFRDVVLRRYLDASNCR